MKKQVKRITLKTDKIVNLSNTQAQQVVAGARPSGSGNTTKWENGIPTCL
ncbi:class I lanthipeptide [Rhodocytophaga aerolata]|uniref:Class I lanthipeptide n=1 Tax=Rhodocytophaga aerolata TaxID=455078 RepID=A0ABT8R9L6_9BACT|nr:class I lanthipeptide [Rhodocytophaga aerolata]MDO1448784.1 class I lanthipeptide [Rhodocytophaga aerolata]